jgi:hypothetical protein
MIAPRTSSRTITPGVLLLTFADGREAMVHLEDWCQKPLAYGYPAVHLGSGFDDACCFVLPRDVARGRNQDLVIPGCTTRRDIVNLVISLRRAVGATRQPPLIPPASPARQEGQGDRPVGGG